MKGIFKKFLSLFLLMLVLVLVGCGDSTTVTTDTTSTTATKVTKETAYVYIHYYRYQGDYDNWTIWAWEYKPTSKDGASYSLSEDSGEFSYGGMVATIPIDTSYEQLGFICRRGEWLEKDISSDRHIVIPSDISSDNPLHVYVLQANEEFAYSLSTAPSKSANFTSAYFKDESTIITSTTSPVKKSDISLYINGVKEELKSIDATDDNMTQTLTLSAEVDFTKSYIIKATFEGVEREKSVSFSKLYDTDIFNDNYLYTRDDHGAYASSKGTTFRIWAPISESVTLNFYNTGTVLSDSTDAHPGSDTKVETIEMERSDKGTWYYETKENLHGTYYTYSVKNAGVTNEIVDPYAKGCGLNGKRGLVVDFSKTNPENWEYGAYSSSVKSNVDSIIYEMHVRDFTISDTWNGTLKQGTYKAISEVGTTYSTEKATYSTGFDHLKDLRITTVQILPFYDWDAGVDEGDLDNPNTKNYNWGYMPINFNCLEGSYSENPWDGLSRITEFKEVSMAYNSANIGINMDVVYNHSGLSADSNFELIIPGYYLRMTSAGTYSNGSGCGNELASERGMVRKFIVDSVCFWTSEYNLSGFRFDLMALIDIETMQACYTALKEINPNIVVYGEPWTGGSTTLNSNYQSSKANINDLGSIGAFNDNFRDGVKGSVFTASGKGWVQGSSTSVTNVIYGIKGVFSTGKSSPIQTINYVACHDNNTLHDKLAQSLSSGYTDSDLLEAAKQSYALVLLSEGMTFIHSGDEFLRAKVKSDGTYDSNSYDSGDAVNAIDWSLLDTNSSMNNYVKDLIAFRKSQAYLHLETNALVDSTLKMVDYSDSSIIAYTLSNSDINNLYSTVLIIHSNKAQDIALPSGDWTLEMNNSGKVSDTSIYNGTVSIKKNETLVFYIK